MNNAHFYPEKCSKSKKYINYTLGVFCVQGKAGGYKTHCRYNFYLILGQQTHFECPKRS